MNELTNAQIDNLVLLGKVWGSLKYYHPSITSGDRHWDFDLFRVLPAILVSNKSRKLLFNAQIPH
jgi:hypothetical protein